MNRNIGLRDATRRYTSFSNSTRGSKPDADAASFPIPAVVLPILAGVIALVSLVIWSWKKKPGQSSSSQANTPAQLTDTRHSVPTAATHAPVISESRGRYGTTVANRGQLQQHLEAAQPRRNGFRRFLSELVSVVRLGGPGAQLVWSQPPARGDAAPIVPDSESRHTRRDQQRLHRHDLNNHLRRTESGHSIRTVPEYKRHVSEGEVMLYKASHDRPLSCTVLSSDGSRRDSGVIGQGGASSPRSQSITASLRDSLRKSVSRNARQHHSRGSGSSSQLLRIQTSQEQEGTEEQAVSGANGEQVQPPSSNPMLLQLNLPQVSLDPIEAMECSTDQDPEPVQVVIVPAPFNDGRPRPSMTSSIPIPPTLGYEELNQASSTDNLAIDSRPPSATFRGIRSIFTRAHRHSHSSPQALEVGLLPLASSSNDRLPHMQNQRRRTHSSTSYLVSRNASESVDSMLRSSPSPTSGRFSRGISAPIRNTLIHIPSSPNLNFEQMRFLNSVESLERYGIPFDDSCTTVAGIAQDPPGYEDDPSSASRVRHPSIDEVSRTIRSSSLQQQQQQQSQQGFRPPPVLTAAERAHRQGRQASISGPVRSNSNPRRRSVSGADATSPVVEGKRPSISSRRDSRRGSHPVSLQAGQPTASQRGQADRNSHDVGGSTAADQRAQG
ncbi:unnamed protein product [Sympodiomycopsis kandeliae]